MDLAHNISVWVMDSWYLYPAPIDLQPENDEYGILRSGDYFASFDIVCPGLKSKMNLRLT